MKKSIILILILFYILNIPAQNITLTFNGTPGTPEEILIENLSNGTSTTLTGTNTITLYESSSISDIDATNMNIYPNPFDDVTFFQFNIKNSETISISVYNELGQKIITKTKLLKTGLNKIKFTASKSGIYFIKVKSKNIQKAYTVVCTNSKNSNTEIYFEGVINEEYTFKNLNKSTKNIVFNIGDILKYTATYSNNISIISDIPTISKTYNFEFYNCIDFENNSYPIVKVGNQWWMAENLNSTKYANGSNISGTYFYNNSSSNEAVYGRLYTWAAIMNGASGNNNNPSGIQGICPNGWHVPSEIEWDEMRDALNGWELMGGKLKETGTSHWIPPNTDATNESGMTVVPGGIRFEDGSFQYLGEQAFFWNTSDFDDLDYASGYTFYSETPSASYYLYQWNSKLTSQSVRCVMD